jgi:hypothetical protein
MNYEYRVVGININPVPKSDPGKASQKLNVSKEFIEQQFTDHYKRNIQGNAPLQVQSFLNMYGKRGWEHYFEGIIGNQVLLYFRRIAGKNIPEVEFTPEEQARLQKLAPDQRP